MSQGDAILVTPMRPVRRALLSVSDTHGLGELAKTLVALSVELVATRGTGRVLHEAGLQFREVSMLTDFPELLGGRVKTLHPLIFGGILSRRDRKDHQQDVQTHHIPLIDLVVVNLYPFEKTTARPGVSLDEAVEQIDIGGPALVRAAAKNFQDVAVLVDPADYHTVADELRAGGGEVSLTTRQRLAQKAFAHTARYDSLIAAWLSAQSTPDTFPDHLAMVWTKHQDLRYGENPHQRAALYRGLSASSASGGGAGVGASIPTARQLHGKTLSYTNILDADSALALVRELSESAAVVVKHANPCGAAKAPILADAYRHARACDPVSAFGGIVAVNRLLDPDTAREITATFMEVVVAPAYHPDALAVLQSKKDLRVLEVGPLDPDHDGPRRMITTVRGGLLVQDQDTLTLPSEMKVVTRRAPTTEEHAALGVAWTVAKHAKSNAVVLAVADRTVGIGAGQSSRVDAVRLAVEKAGNASKGGVMASDAFFPFRDSVDVAAAAGITAVIQPGGSVRDQEVIQAADEHGLAMVFTGVRHFRH